MARRIGLAYCIARPIAVWTAAIPGKFIYDAIVREREVRWSKDRYLPPRREALRRAAEDLRRGETGQANDDGGGAARARLVGRLVQHYEAVLAAEGLSYGDLLKAAFPRPVELEVEWRDIAELEAEMDEGARRLRPDDAKLAERLRAHQAAAANQRERFVRELYYS